MWIWWSPVILLQLTFLLKITSLYVWKINFNIKSRAPKSGVKGGLLFFPPETFKIIILTNPLSWVLSYTCLLGKKILGHIGALQRLHFWFLKMDFLQKSPKNRNPKMDEKYIFKMFSQRMQNNLSRASYWHESTSVGKPWGWRIFLVMWIRSEDQQKNFLSVWS